MKYGDNERVQNQRSKGKVQNMSRANTDLYNNQG